MTFQQQLATMPKSLDRNQIWTFHGKVWIWCCRDLVGHGIGTEMHEDPQIPNFRQKRKGMKLQAGMTLAIEQ